jgi:hypothetical protein
MPPCYVLDNDSFTGGAGHHLVFELETENLQILTLREPVVNCLAPHDNY